MNRFLLTTALLASLASPAAAAQLNIEVFDGATLVDSVTSVDGIANLSATDVNFASIDVTATGAPIVPNADLSTVELNVKGASAGTHVLTIDVFQTGVSAPAGSRLESTFSTNDLIGDPGPTVESTFFNGTSGSLGALLATHTFAVGDIVDSFGPVTTPIGTALFADAHQYMVTFTAAGQSSNDTIELSTTVPEASTWAMMVLGLGFMLLVGGKYGSKSKLRPADHLAA